MSKIKELKTLNMFAAKVFCERLLNKISQSSSGSVHEVCIYYRNVLVYCMHNQCTERFALYYFVHYFIGIGSVI